MAERVPVQRPTRPGEQPAPQPPTANAPAETNGPDTTTHTATEFAELKAKMAEHDAREKKRGTVIRTLAATLLMPASTADGGQQKKQSLRNALLALVEEFAPDEDE